MKFGRGGILQLIEGNEKAGVAVHCGCHGRSEHFTEGALRWSDAGAPFGGTPCQPQFGGEVR